MEDLGIGLLMIFLWNIPTGRLLVVASHRMYALTQLELLVMDTIGVQLLAAACCIMSVRCKYILVSSQIKSLVLRQIVTMNNADQKRCELSCYD